MFDVDLDAIFNSVIGGGVLFALGLRITPISCRGAGYPAIWRSPVPLADLSALHKK